MAGQIRFNSANATSSAKSILTKAEEANGIINKLTKEINSLNSWWDGESQKAFVDQYNELKPSFEKMVECVRTISKNLTEVARIKDDAETQMAAKLRSK